jgi:hypothetical protein
MRTQGKTREEPDKHTHPAEDIPGDGGKAKEQREPASKMEQANREMPRAFPDRDPTKKKTGEF